MTATPLAAVPEAHRPAVVDALDAIGLTPVAVEPVIGGASGALLFRVDGADGRVLLRIETARDLFRNPQRSFACLQAAADVGVAPAVHHADAARGVVVMDLVDVRPLEDHPGGVPALVTEVAGLVRRLQGTPVFPPLLGGYESVLSGLLDFVEGSDVFAAGALAGVRERFDDARRSYPWTADLPVSAHNDLNQRNLLSDGERVWIVDWELAFANDPLADLATLANELEATGGADLVEPMVATWWEGPVDDALFTRLRTMQLFDHVFYGCITLSQAAGAELRLPAVEAPAPDQLGALVASGELRLGSPELLRTIGLMHLAAV